MVATVIADGRATLNELRTIYSLKDLFEIWEACYIPKLNLWKEREHQKELQKLHQRRF